MALADTIASALARAVTMLGTSWQVAVRTSAPTSAPTFAAYAAVTAVATGEQEQEVDSDRGYTRMQLISVRIGGSTIYSIGDKLKSPSNVEYVITGINSTGYGTTSYTAKRVDVNYIGKGGVE